jgi:membrane protein insertase Oxa1/YidC/SpoIIIJ
MLKILKIHINKKSLLKTINKYSSSKFDSHNIPETESSKSIFSILKDFNVNFSKDVKFIDFESQMRRNIEMCKLEEIKEVPTSKLQEILQSQGIEKTQEEIDLLTKIVKESNLIEEPMRFMDLSNFEKRYKEKMGDTKMKFMMPIGWGWAYPFVKYTSILLITAKTFTGLSWLSFFMLCGLIVRVVFLPFALRQMVLIHRMAKVTPNIRLLGFCTMKSNLSLTKKAYYFSRAVWKYSTEAKVNPISFFAYNIFQMPIFFLLVMSIRKICYEENLSGTGILWFKNLNEADPYMILPLISVGITYFNLGRGINKDNEHWFINRWRSFFQIIQICYLPFTCNWPAVFYFSFRALTYIGLHLHCWLMFKTQY